MDWMEKLDDHSIDELLKAEKHIITKDPKSGFKEEFNHLRSDLLLEAASIKAKFRMFLRQNKTYPENFSIGLVFYGTHGDVLLIRFNGAHKRIEDSIDNHHCKHHIHYEACHDDSTNSIQTIEETTEYSDFFSAIRYAMDRLHIKNYWGFFPNLDQMQIELE